MSDHNSRMDLLIATGRSVVHRAQTEPDYGFIERKFTDAVDFLRINPGDSARLFCGLRPSLKPLLDMLQAAGFATKTDHPNKECPGDDDCKCRRQVTITVSIPMDGCA